MLRRRSTKILVLLAALALVAGVVQIARAPADATHLTLSAFKAELRNRTVSKAKLASRDHSIAGTLTDGSRFVVDYPVSAEHDLTNAMELGGVVFATDPQRPSAWVGFASNVVPLLLTFVMLAYLFRKIGGRMGTGFAKSKAKIANKDRPQVKFCDVAGIDEAVEELNEIKEFLQDPKKFERLGARIPKGVLLYGPPGTGKTLLARAVAGEAGVPFLTLSGSDFVEMFVGVGAARVRDLFAQAKACAPSIIFVDEIDAVGRHRGAGVGGGHDEREQTLNQLLVEMDGFETNTGVILIAATNRPDILDPALLRPGRFDRQIAVDAPDRAGRAQILEVHANGKPVADGVDYTVIARRTPGFTGADLANVVNEAALLAARYGFTTIGLPQFEAAIDRVLAGPERRSRLIAEDERQIIAYHEAGHALVGHVLAHTDPVHKVSIVARGRALGYTLTLPAEDRVLVRRSQLCDETSMLLGGRAAELLVFNDPTTGAQNDIERATAVARQMIMEFGMTERLGPVRLAARDGEVFLGRSMGNGNQYSEEVAAEIDAEVRTIVDRAHDRATSILIEHRMVLDELASALVEHETLDREALSTILDRAPRHETTIVLPGANHTVGAVAATALEGGTPTSHTLL